MQKKKINLTERQLRFIEAIKRTGRGGNDRSDVVRQALNARIQKFIDDGAIKESDGGEPETTAPESPEDDA